MDVLDNRATEKRKEGKKKKKERNPTITMRDFEEMRNLFNEEN